MPLALSPLFSLTRTPYADREIVIDPATGKRAVRRCPVPWSDTACTILFSKYARKTGCPHPEGEIDASEIFARLASAWAHWALKLGYVDPKGSNVLYAESHAMLEQQVMAPNSPQWFNTGLELAYGITGSAQGHWAIDLADSAPVPRVVACEDALSRPQVSACFIQSVTDDLVNPGGIMDLVQREARVFKFGGGSGSNFSAIRGKGEPLAGGGTSSGLLSFLRVGDTSAGSIKSGGTTRRAAKMVVVDVDHPDVLEFVRWKAGEENKIRVLQAAGYSAGMDGEAATSAQGQNANNSVRVTDAFMEAVKCDGAWNLTRRTDGAVTCTMPARDLWHEIAQAAWACADPGLQFHTTINAWHTCRTDGDIVGSNPCSEYMWLDDTACNLASINLVRFLTGGGGFDFDAFAHAVRLCTIILDVSVTMAGYPTRAIAEGSRDYRTLGLGWANLGGLLMRMGIPYDSDEGRTLCGNITSVMGARSWLTSAELAEHLGAFPRFDANREHVLRVLTMHRDAASEGTRHAWDLAIEQVSTHGARNAQCTLLAPTGTIGLVMDCDSTGIEPVYSLLSHKSLAGGGSIVQPCAAAEAYLSAWASPDSVWIDDAGKVCTYYAGAVGEQAIKVLECANDLSAEAHLLMMAAAQPFLCGAISKTVNLPNSATVQDVAATYARAHELGLKAIALYRAGCKATEVYRSAPAQHVAPTAATPLEPTDALVWGARRRPERGDEGTMGAGPSAVVRVAGDDWYLHTHTWSDGKPCEIFLTANRQGSAVAGWSQVTAILASLALQYGCPVEELIEKLRYQRFDPADFRATSPADAFAQALDRMYCGAEPGPVKERAQPAAAPSSGQTCSECGGGDLRRSGSCYVCASCGTTTGCS